MAGALWLSCGSAPHAEAFFDELDDLLGAGSIFDLRYLHDLQVQVLVDDDR